MRVFLAVDLETELRRRLSALARELRPLARNARWLSLESLHLTLRFFGETSKEDLEVLARGLRQSLSGLPGFPLHFQGSGVFPDRKRPRVFWVGVHEPPRELADLQSKAEKVARDFGFTPERRPFEPHLTVARFRGPETGVESMLRAAGDRDFGKTDVSEVLLFESRSSPKGASYHVLERYRLSVSPSGGISGERLI
ncbi:MAG: RNA 2',3'-cyclic phosphodiesterase [Vicinamibacteria bacterium]